MNDWGIPDWTAWLAYGATGAWPEERWRWEFTRRREDYREAFDRALQSLKSPVEQPEDIFPESIELFFSQIRCWPFAHAEAASFKLDAMYDPMQSDWHWIGPTWNSGLICGEEKGPGFATYTFDLSRPLKPQLRELERELNGDQFNHLVYGPGREDKYEIGEEQKYFDNVASKEIRRRKHPELWLTYLRVLDGREVGASWAQIFEVALKDTKGANANPAQEARGVWERARDLMFNWPD